MTDPLEITAVGPEPGSEIGGVLFTESALKSVTETTGTVPVTVDQERGPIDRVGTVTNISYDEERGPMFDVEIHDEEIAQKIEAELAGLSPIVTVDKKMSFGGTEEMSDMSLSAMRISAFESSTEIETDGETINLSDYVER